MLREPLDAQLRAELERIQDAPLVRVVRVVLRLLKLFTQPHARANRGRGALAEDELRGDGVVHGAGDGAQRVVVGDFADAHALGGEPVEVVGTEERRGQAAHEAAVAGGAPARAGLVGVQRLGEALEAGPRGVAHVGGPAARLAAGPVAAPPLEKVLARTQRNVVLATAARAWTETVPVGEEDGARHVRVVGGVAGGPSKGATAGNVTNGAAAMGIGGLNIGVGFELDTRTEGVAGMEAEECADDARLPSDGWHVSVILNV